MFVEFEMSYGVSGNVIREFDWLNIASPEILLVNNKYYHEFEICKLSNTLIFL